MDVPWWPGAQPGYWDIGTVMRHELGHTLMLYHPPSGTDAVLVSGTGFGEVVSVRLDDANGARALYPNWFVNTTSGSAFYGDQAGFHTWYGTRLSDQGLTGDFNGDGKTDMLVYRPTIAEWFVKLSQGSSFSGGWHVTWGNTSGDIPLVGDMNGDGRDDIVIYRTNGTFPNIFVNLSNGSTFTGTADSASWGLPSDQPIIGNFSGGGGEDIAVRRPSNATWYFNYYNGGFDNGTDRQATWGNAGTGDMPVAGNFNGSGAEDIMIYRASSSGWYVNLGYAFDGSTDFSTGWGNTSGDTPLVNDFNRDGRADLGIFRTGSYPNWFTKMSTGSGFTGTGGFSTSWGEHDINTEKPLVGNFNGTGGGDVAMFRYWQN